MNASLEITRAAIVRTSRLPSQVRPFATFSVLAVADAAALLAATSISIAIWAHINSERLPGSAAEMWPVPLMFLAVYSALGLYPGVGISPVEEMRRVAAGSSIVYLGLAGAMFLRRDGPVLSRGVFILAWLLSAAVVPLGRAAVRKLCASRPWWGVPVLVFGAGQKAALVVEAVRGQPGLGLKPVVCLDDNPACPDCAGIEVAGPFSAAPELARALRVRHALVALPQLSAAELLLLLERWGASFPHVLIIPDLLGMASLWVTARDLGGVLGLEVRQNLLLPLNRWLKRSLDLAAGAAFSIAALPLVGLATIWIKRASPGSAFYEQQREGEGGRLIRVRKLRTMYPDADRMLARHLERNPEARSEWQQHFKLKNDPRVLPGIGKFLRRTSLDELPQLWNVLKGEMSLVGPRPFPCYHLEQFDSEFRRLRRKAPPGLTGLWQVSARSDGDLRIQQKLDTYYIRNWSLWLDLYILARTLKAVLAPNGAY